MKSRFSEVIFYIWNMRNSLIFCVFLLFFGCKKDVVHVPSSSEIVNKYLNLPAKHFNYANPELPDYLLTSQYITLDNTPATNPTTDAGATLGRVLFYDKNLSKNRTIACASCHKQENAFSDDAVLSEGFEGYKTARHSMGLINNKYYMSGKYFWDERANTLEDQVLMPMQDSVEMGMTLPEVLNRLKSLEYYPILFKEAFGSSEITTEKTAMALAQYVRSIVSYQSKYDVGRAMVEKDFYPFPNFTAQENEGKNLFMGPNGFRCMPCHGSEVFSSAFVTSNGLDATTTDAGTGAITGNAIDEGRFKAPSVKSILLRAPYMHDGRFATIEEVLDHYSTNIQPHPNLDQELKDFNTGLPKRMNMTAQEKSALIAFFGTLTDSVLLNDPKFSDPFK